jgi:hypothetical protein
LALARSSLRGTPETKIDRSSVAITRKYGLGTVRVVFSSDPSGTATGVHLDGLLLSAEKHSRSTVPRVAAAGVVGVLGVATTVTAFGYCRICGSREASAAPLQWCR